MPMKLFSDSDSDIGDDDISSIKIDEKFAKRFEHNKRREDLQRLEELKKRGLINDSDDSDSDLSSSDDEPGVVSKKKDLEIFDVLLKVKNNDPTLKDPNAPLFNSESSEEEDGGDDEEKKRNEREKKSKKSKKKKYLKDVVAEQLIEGGPEVTDEEEEEEEEKEEKKKVKSYAEEQEEIRRQFLKAMEEAEKEDGDDDDDQELFKVKKKVNENGEEEDDDEVKKRVDEYFGDELDENEMFLKEFLKNKMWIGEDKGKGGVDDDDDIEVSEDEEELEKQEDFEREYNFRFEENVGDRILGHSRFVEGSVRKKENARKRQRERKEERMTQAEMEMKEEVKRLKNLKKKEIMDKVNRLREVAGLGEDGSVPLTADDLEEDFDPEEYDKKMNAAFGDDYYAAEDADPEFGSDNDEDVGDLEKPDFEKEDELLGLPKDWDVCKPGDGFLSERERYLKSKAEIETSDPQAVEDEEKPEEGKRKRKKKLSLKEKVALEKDLDELYKLDYEDSIGDLKTRFKYKSVAPRRFGLNPVELLVMDDKDLNQYVSLKKIAPYQEQEWKVPRVKRAMQKKLLQEKLQEQVHKGEKRKSDTSNSAAVENRNKEGEKPRDDAGGLSRKAKRRRRQAELKLSDSRLIAYGKIKTSSVSKKKSKNKSIEG